MSPSNGRPKSDNPKDTMIRVRMDRNTVEKLDHCTKALKTTRSEIIRMGIGKIEAELKK